MVSKEQFEIVGDGLLVRAPAKINLSLLIAGKRPDGFHEIETVMAKVDFFDEILIEQSQKAGIELLCKGPYWAPAGKENLVYQAAKMLLNSCGSQNVIPARDPALREPKAGIKITLTKNIPAGSGLGSASSDAAATLIGIKRFLQLVGAGQCACPQGNHEGLPLREMAAKLGSDVTFFLNGPLAFCTGKGEKIDEIDEIFDFSALLILPNVSVSTKRVYANYKHDSALYGKLNSRINSYIQKNRIDLVSKMCANMLQASCFCLYKELAELKTKVELLGIGPLCLSGSGSAMFCIVDSNDFETAKENKRKVQETFGCKSIIVSNNRW
jgi:4-diphosphocytidyl-2-C-methyl-D-erythritol kinase